MALIVRFATALLGAALAVTVIALVPALFVLAGGRSLESLTRWAPLVFVVALGHALILGLPAAALFHRLGWVNAFSALAVGFLIGALPAGLLLSMSPSADFASIDGVATVVAGRRTSAGWIEAFTLAGLLGLLGAAGGLAGWAIWRGSALATWGVGGSATAVAILLFLSPSPSTDRSCHIPLRNGQTPIGPEMSAGLRVDRDDWPALTVLFQRHAQSMGWSFRETNTDQPIPTLDLSMCSAAGTLILGTQQTRANDPEFLRVRGVSIIVYQPQGGDGWEADVRPLLQGIEQRWPGRLVFFGSRGEQIDPPLWLLRLAP